MDKITYHDVQLLHGDCLELMKSIPDESVDAVITDPPYGILTGHKIETDVDIPRFFNECYRVLKPNSFIVYFGLQPTLSYWNIEAFKLFKYKKEIIWYKRHSSSPMNDISKLYENIMVIVKDNKKFNDAKLPYFDFKESMADLGNIDGFKRDLSEIIGVLKRRESYELVIDFLDTIKRKEDLKRFYTKKIGSRNSDATFCKEVSMRLPITLNRVRIMVDGYKAKDIVSFIPHNKQRFDMTGQGLGDHNVKHPTVKPIQLLEYLLDLTTNEGDLVLDPFMGSGTTGIACRNLNRRFIGMELHQDYFDIARGRILGDYPEATEEDETTESPKPPVARQLRLL